MDTTDAKKPRERSKEYPQYGLEFCLSLTETVHSKLGNRYSSPEQLSKVFGKSITYLGTQLSSCKQYGLLDLKKGEGYKPTELFYKATRGRTDKDKRDALIQSFMNPTIYNDFVWKYDGHPVPSDLPSIFYWDYKITESAKDAAAKVFLENLEVLKLISSDGKLSVYEENKQEENPNQEVKIEPEIDKQEIKEVDTVKQNRQNQRKKLDLKMADIKIYDGRFVSIEYPEDLTNQDIDKLIKILETWKD